MRHVFLGLKKKVLALSKLKDCEELANWIRSITNHLYWVAASTPDADRDLMYQKWQSLSNHIQNVHEGHGDKFPKCLHRDFTGQERRKRWLKPGKTSCTLKLYYNFIELLLLKALTVIIESRFESSYGL